MLSLQEFLDKLDVSLSPQQRLLVEALESTKSIFISVPRCCGKTYLRKLYEEYCKEKGLTP